MDFPKSVPGVGLVGGQFADEDPALGRQGSLIPSAWGNAVTQELLNVIQAAGLEPNEVQTDQLLEAIRTLVPERSAFARVSGTLILPATAFGIYALADGGVAATVTLPSTADLVDDTELLLFANHTNSASMQVKAAAGQTVQGPAALMAGSTTAFMLPAGGDWVRLRSEKAQGRWVVVACYAAGVMGAVLAERARVDVTAQFEVTLNATLTGSDNNIAAENLAARLGLEKGDVIQLKADTYTKLHTVESLTNANNLAVNWEHCGARGNGSLKLPDYAGQVTVKRIAKWFNASDGLGQAWVRLTAFRSNTSIFNSNINREVEVSISSNAVANGSQYFVGGVEIAIDNPETAVAMTVNFGVPLNTEYYRTGQPFSNWAEKR